MRKGKSATAVIYDYNAYNCLLLSPNRSSILAILTFCSSVKTVGIFQLDMNLNASALVTARARSAIVRRTMVQQYRIDVSVYGAVVVGWYSSMKK